MRSNTIHTDKAGGERHSPPAGSPDERLPERRPVAMLACLLALLTLWTGLGRAQQPPELRSVSPQGLADCLKARQGHPLLLVYWASWCLPCRHYKEKLALIRARYSEEQLQMLGVALDTDRPRVKAYLAQQPLPYPTVVADQALLAAHMNVPVPTTVFYKSDGSEAWRFSGDVRQERLDHFVSRLVEQPEQTPPGP